MSSRQLILVRHAQAVSEIDNFEQPLSTTGLAQARHIAAVTSEVIPEVDVIYHSSKRRAEETAEILGGTIKSTHGIRWRGGLNPNDPPADFIKELASEDHQRIMIVGHLPFLEELAAQLLGGRQSPRAVRFSLATAANLVRSGRRWKLMWMINPAAVELPAER